MFAHMRSFVRRFSLGKPIPRTSRVGLSVELLEGRVLPASYLWVGNAGDSWSVQTDWKVWSNATGSYVVQTVNPQAPGAQDNVRLSTVDGGANTDGVDNIPEVKNLLIDPTYTSKITITSQTPADRAAGVNAHLTVATLTALGASDNSNGATFTGSATTQLTVTGNAQLGVVTFNNIYLELTGTCSTSFQPVFGPTFQSGATLSNSGMITITSVAKVTLN